MDYTDQDFSETAGGEFKNTLDIGKSPGSSSQGFCFILVQKKKNECDSFLLLERA